MPDSRNYIVAIVLSLVVLLGWQYFIVQPKVEEQRRQDEIAQTAARNQAAQGQGAQTPTAPGAPGAAPVPGATGLPSVAGGVAVPASRDTVIAASSRSDIHTESLNGSINLTGGRIDDLHLVKYREEVDPSSPTITLLSPSGSASPYYANVNWTADPGAQVALPTPTTVWTQEGTGALTAESPVTITWDNGEGLIFKRTISLDKDYMFNIEQSVENTTGADVRLYPYGLISRHGKPETTGFYILHEGLIGVFGEEGLKEVDYDDVEESGEVRPAKAASGWLGITDKYWATALVPADAGEFQGRFSYGKAAESFQADYLGDVVVAPAGGSAQSKARLFAGAKQVDIIDGYQEEYGIHNFELMIDWGWFHFITKPMFFMIDWFYKLVGNFGVAILLSTVVVKLVFFPLANKSYVSMSRMKLVQPQMIEIRERHKDDKAKQQQAMMELYKKEKINPLAGCLPVVVQIPVFFALYKVLFVSIEMRHAPFFGWIRDLSAPDPTSIFTLFGLFPWDAPQMLMIGIWPLIMGVTMFVQMKMNPAPTEPAQQMIFNWMPVMFTFMLGSFPAGLVIYWAWNNSLSILQQYVIMRRQGVKVELFDNIRAMFKKKSKAESN